MSSFVFQDYLHCISNGAISGTDFLGRGSVILGGGGGGGGWGRAEGAGEGSFESSEEITAHQHLCRLAAVHNRCAH